MKINAKMEHAANHFIAVFISFLVIAIPIYTADAYAAGLSVTKSSGNKNVEGYFDGAGDNWNINVRANLDGKEVKPDMISLLFSSGIEKFQSCSPSGVSGAYDCSWVLPSTAADDGSFSVSLKLKDSDTGSEYPAAASIQVDSFSPMILIRSAKQSGDKADVSYKITDPGSFCSGIEKIEFYDSGNLIDSIIDINSCNYDTLSGGRNIINIPSSGTALKAITIKAYDRLGHLSTKTTHSFTIDNTAPSIDESSLSFGNLSSYTSGRQMNMDISVNVTEDVGMDYVKADFSSIGLGASENAVCVQQAAGKYKCTWPNRLVTLISSVSVSITAVDLNSNENTKTIARAFQIDTTPPKITSITTGSTFNNKAYSPRKEINLTAVVEESESGISSSNIELDFSGINKLYTSYKKADKCEKNADEWKCYWHNVFVAKTGTVYSVKAKDNVGNDASGNQNLPSVEITVDDSIPELKNLSITARGGVFASSLPYLMSNDFVDISADISEPTDIKAFGNFSGIVNNGDDSKEASCIKNSNNSLYNCLWSGIGPLKSGYYKGKIVLEFIDSSGNTLKHVKDIEIFESSNETKPNYWSIGDISSMPEAIDRQTTKLATQRMYFSIPLIPVSDDVEILETTLGNCQGAYLYSSRLLSNMIGSKNPYAVIELSAFDSKNTSSLPFRCNLNIFSKKGNKIIVNPEFKNISFEVKFYNLPLGSVDKSITKLIKKEKEDINSGIWAVIKYLNVIIKWSKWLCNILHLIQTIKDIFIKAEGGFIGFGELKAAPFYVAVCHSTEHMSKTQYLFVFADKYCKFISCRPWNEIMYSTSAAKGEFGKSTAPDWLTSTNDFYQKIWGYKALGLQSPSDSIINSVATLCLPGILYNLEKYRQIKCRYVYCLQKEVPAGIPLSACKELKAYEECKYFYGEIFQAIPFIGPLNVIFSQLKQMLSDPVGLFMLAPTLLCRQFCVPGGAAPHIGCQFYGWLRFVMDLYEDIKGFVDSFKSIKNDYCHLIEDTKPEKLEPKATTTK